MPAQSQQQQKLFGLALAFKRGEVPASEVSDEIKAIADRMSEKEIEDFAATKHKGLPKMKEQLRKIVREIMRERAISEIELSKDDMEKLHSDGEVEVDGEKVTFEEGKKRFRQQDGIGKAKYTISYHDGKQKHKDGSDFFGIQIFKNKKDLETFRNALLKKGYIEESVNEMQVVNKKTGKDITRHVLDLLKGKIDKKKFEKLTGLKKESVNEGYSTEEKRIVMMAVRKLAKYRNVPLDYAINDLLGAGQELERDIKKGKITK